MRCMPSQPTRAGVWQIQSRLALEITPNGKAKMEVFFFLPFKTGGKNWTKNGFYHTSLARACLGM